MSNHNNIAFMEVEFEELAEDIKIILDRGIDRFNKVLSVLEITGTILTNDCRDMLFKNYEQSIILYKYANELIRINRETKHINHLSLVQFKNSLLLCLKAMRNIIDFLRITGNMLSNNYVEDITMCSETWMDLRMDGYSFAAKDEPNDIESAEKHQPKSDDITKYLSYEQTYGKVEYEDEYTQP